MNKNAVATNLSTLVEEDMICEMLHPDVIEKVFKYVPAAYRFLGTVNKLFFDVSTQHDVKGKHSTYKYGISTLPALKVYLKERKDEQWADDKRIASQVGARAGQIHLMKWASRQKDNEVFSAASRGGNGHVIEWICTRNYEWDSETCVAAAWGEHLELLVWLREMGCPWEASIRDICAKEAARYMPNLHQAYILYTRDIA